ncbi:DUF4982 domain-containing protein, partial [Maribacter sp. 2304DJ31-5]|uniref:DUF4982 domain-containing protein n=1 Tax=Maribacter sp. 2304DJ31-5 TaxID=3386273 RepID=UPI0039BD2AA3
IFRIPKFANYFYRSQRPPDEKIVFGDMAIGGPMVKIASYWNENSPLPVKVYSNCDEVALFLNGEIVDRKKMERDRYSTHLEYPPYVFDIKTFKKGKLVAMGYINGEKVCEDKVVTSGGARQLALELDMEHIAPADNDIVILHARVLDQYGNMIHDANDEVNFSVMSGNAELIGENPVKAKAGIASILMKIANKEKPIQVVASTPTLDSSIIELTQ